jgi:hypothetical protein
VLKLHTMPACAQRTAAQLRLCLRRAAFEDFIGRGDRRIGAVIQRAWELGATNDAWCGLDPPPAPPAPFHIRPLPASLAPAAQLGLPNRLPLFSGCHMAGHGGTLPAFC